MVRQLRGSSPAHVHQGQVYAMSSRHNPRTEIQVTMETETYVQVSAAAWHQHRHCTGTCGLVALCARVLVCSWLVSSYSQLTFPQGPYAGFEGDNKARNPDSDSLSDIEGGKNNLAFNSQARLTSPEHRI